MNLPKMSKLLIIFLALFILSVGCQQTDTLKAEDLMNPEKLLAYRKNVSEKNRALANSMYQYGINAAKKDSASASKAFSESALMYPTSAAFIKMAEHRAKMLVKKEDKVKQAVLSEIINYLQVADKLNAVDHMLSNDERAMLAQDKACTEEYFESKKIPTSCRPLTWLGLN